MVFLVKSKFKHTFRPNLRRKKLQTKIFIWMIGTRANCRPVNLLVLQHYTRCDDDSKNNLKVDGLVISQEDGEDERWRRFTTE